MISTPLSQNYSKEEIEKAIAILSYKKVTPLPKNESGKYPILYVFRHGQTEDNANFIFSGWRDSDLTEVGVAQAMTLAQKLKDKKIHMLIASDQIRAIKTMKIAVSLNTGAKNLEITKEPRIKERSYGELQGKSKLEAYLKNPEQLARDRRDYYYAPPMGESIEMVVKRVNDFCDEIIPLIKENGFNVAISCHGNSIRGFRQRFENLSINETMAIDTVLAQDYAAYEIS